MKRDVELGREWLLRINARLGAQLGKPIKVSRAKALERALFHVGECLNLLRSETIRDRLTGSGLY